MHYFRSASALCLTTIHILSLASASTLQPPVLPLIVRNPYLSTWLADARNDPWTSWPMFYTGQELGLGIVASVRNQSLIYPLLGRAHETLTADGTYNISEPAYLGAQYDASTTNLTYSISEPQSPESVELTISFLSPITPTSTLRQSIPAAYIFITAKGGLDLNIYVEVNGQWVSGDSASSITWSLEENDEQGLTSWRVERDVEQLFTEVDDRAEWGTLYFTAPSNVSHESGSSRSLRHSFAKTGKLENKDDKSYRSIDDEEPAFAFAKHLALNTSHEDSIWFTVAQVQDPVVQFASSRGLTLMKPLWKSYFFDDASLIAFHYNDFHKASHLAANYSAQLALDAFASGSDKYEEIVALSARQVMGATVFAGTPDNPMLFLKEISSNGNSQTVDVIFPSFPFFVYTNPRWLAYLLEPLLEHMLSGQYPNNYTMHDLGTHFPNLTGHADGKDEYMPVEECGDMFIMGLALVNSLRYGQDHPAQSIWSDLGEDDTEMILAASDSQSPFALLPRAESSSELFGIDNRFGGDRSAEIAKKWLDKSYILWKRWATYLVDYSLKPHNQLSTDDFAGWLALQTNLALKGIIGLRAMTEMAHLVGNKDEERFYRNISETYIKQWQILGMSSDGERAKLAYNWHGSWTTLYSLYADAILCFHPGAENSSSSIHGVEDQQPMLEQFYEQTISANFIPHKVYKTQSDWYDIAMQKFGLPLDSRHLYAKSDWEFQAAAVANAHTRTEILNRVARWVNETVTDRPFSDLYETEGEGGFPGPNFFARPVVGSHFSFLALERACGGKGAAPFA